MTPLLLLHAGVADSRMWRQQAEALSATHQVITPDFRGYGDAPLVPEYSDAGDVLAFLDELGLDQVAAVGASYGGYVLQQAASQQPDRFTRLVLLCAPTDNVEPDEPLRAVWAEENRLLEAGDLNAASDLAVEHFLGPEADDNARALLHTMQNAPTNSSSPSAT